MVSRYESSHNLKRRCVSDLCNMLALLGEHLPCKRLVPVSSRGLAVYFSPRNYTVITYNLMLHSCHMCKYFIYKIALISPTTARKQPDLVNFKNTILIIYLF